MGNNYRCSDGSKLSKSVIDRRIREAKAEVVRNQMYYVGWNYCEHCDRSGGVYFDCAHIVSVDKCQKSGQAEKAFDVDNIIMLCRECHKEHDGL